METEEKPDTIFRGNLLFYFAKISLLLIGGTIMAACVVALTYGSYMARQQQPDFPLISVPEVGIAISIIIGLILLTLSTHLYPEIGISSGYFWFRVFWRWQKIPWHQVSRVEVAKLGWIFPTGFLVYSEQLPFFYQFYARAYGSGAGKAVIIWRHLRHYRQLQELIAQYKVIVK
jgi:hypothetical protein